MIVRCKKLISPNGEDLGNYSPWYTLEKEYVVLGLKMNPKWGLRIIVLSDDNSPSAPSLLGFEIITQNIPLDWQFHIIDGYMYMLPKNWGGPHFLNEVDDEEISSSIELFYKEAESIHRLEGRSIEWKNIS